MDVNYKERIDAIINDLVNVTDLNIKKDILNYMVYEAAYLLDQMEDELRIDEASRNF
ncbi:MAG: hypothetical protein II532_03345 [Bacteroidales bacterium]|nr:hypothetical protein [Bacteroidales bacterium]